jgi:fermentation-respiration switch protein FrsA (DUF1100 family)
MVYVIIFVVLCVIGVILLALTHNVFNKITRMQVKSNDAILQILEQAGTFTKQKFQALPKQKVHITSYDGLQLHGYIIKAVNHSPRWVIIVHGYTANLYLSTQYIDLFQQEGFNILLVDQRRHGESEGEFSTYGYKEKYDIQSWVTMLTSQYGKDIIVGLHCQSLGGGTVLEYLSIAQPNVKFVIADCPYSDLTELIRYQIKVLNKAPLFPLINLVNWSLKRKAGFSLEQVSPIKAAKNSLLPVMFIHGTEDTYVPTQMSVDMYNVKQGVKKLLLIPKAIHANAFSIDPELYTSETIQFIRSSLSA